ncbi:FAD-dependent oxidoreductase [Streptomyces sp. NPDC002851]
MATADVIVVGGGVIGLTTAVVLAERGARVRVWAREPAEDTTSAVAGALWWPYRIEPAELVASWALESLREHTADAEAPDETGVRLVSGVHAGQRLSGLGAWAGGLPGLREVYGDEVPGAAYERGVRVRLPLIDMAVHLAWLRRRLAAAGGVVELRGVRDLAEAGAVAPVVVNCSGLGARELVPDPEVFGVRGQLVLVENPGVEEWFTDAAAGADALTYFFPRGDVVALGGTAEEGAEGRVPDPAVAAAIVARCAAVRPELGRAQVVRHLVGVRPGRRSGVRLEREQGTWGGLLVHNYGHGGAGVTVAWGCARAAAELVDPGRNAGGG